MRTHVGACSRSRSRRLSSRPMAVAAGVEQEVEVGPLPQARLRWRRWCSKRQRRWIWLWSSGLFPSPKRRYGLLGFLLGYPPHPSSFSPALSLRASSGGAAKDGRGGAWASFPVRLFFGGGAAKDGRGGAGPLREVDHGETRAKISNDRWVFSLPVPDYCPCFDLWMDFFL